MAEKGDVMNKNTQEEVGTCIGYLIGSVFIFALCCGALFAVIRTVRYAVFGH